jgi:hypothetical protein
VFVCAGVDNNYFILSDSGLTPTACAMNLPEEIIEMVLCHLSGKDLMQLCLAGKSFSNVLLLPKPWKVTKLIKLFMNKYY